MRGDRRRPHGREHKGGPRAAGRRPPPPESTGFEALYLQQQREARAPVRVVLEDGGSIEGIVRGFERDVLVVQPEIGDAVRIRKSGIRYIQELSQTDGSSTG
jgi:hypothetical protein